MRTKYPNLAIPVGHLFRGAEVMASRIVLLVGAAFLAAVTIYVLWHHTQFLNTFDRGAAFLGAPVAGGALCLAALRLPSGARTSLALILVSITAAVYGFEGYLVARNTGTPV